MSEKVFKNHHTDLQVEQLMLLGGTNIQLESPAGINLQIEN